MTQYLVFTAVGTDRTGILSEITALTSEFGCNVVDSRMAILGNEFTLIMLLSGTKPAINQFEIRLPLLAHSLQLLTISKQTSEHLPFNISKSADIYLSGEDSLGQLKKLTRFFAKRKIDVSSLKAVTDKATGLVKSYISINIPHDVEYSMLEEDFKALCKKLHLTLEINIKAPQLL